LICTKAVLYPTLQRALRPRAMGRTIRVGWRRQPAAAHCHTLCKRVDT
jgi:hypothetical protein